MPRSEKQKLKLPLLLRILLRETDENHGLSMEEILNRLDREDITAERKSIYADFQSLSDLGYEVNRVKQNRVTYYSIPDRDFELSELKLLTDAVQSARFITEKKSRTLIEKLGKLTSVHEAKKLQRQVLTAGRVKSMNESIYYTVDAVHEAINNDHRIRFRYFNYNTKKEAVYRNDGAYYVISPWALVWDNEYYYLIGYDGSASRIKHFRVDKMAGISEVTEKREGAEVFTRLDLSRYTESLFGMYGGERYSVTLECRNDFAGIIIDRFGKNVMMIPAGPDCFHVTVEVSVSNQFLSWVAGVSEGVRILSPEPVVEKMKAVIRQLSSQYT